ncbi:MAG: hypothetical protein U9N36_09410 [Euryarchaeota archaeon]|nr:hypothetical protein [Euryarchaeota archaeon]
MMFGELRHDLGTITFLADYIVMTLKYQGNIPVGGNRRGTGIICTTCEEMNIGTMNRYMQVMCLSEGFSDRVVSS